LYDGITAHGGMWGDVFIISPLVAAIVGYYWSTWAWWQVLGAAGIGFAASYVMHETYKAAPWPEAHVEGGHLTDVGCVHLGYMAFAFAALLLYYVRPVSQTELAMMGFASGLLVLHVVLGTHVPLGMLKRDDPESFWWYPGEPLKSAGTWGAIAGTAILTFGRTAVGYAGF
jgi:hypothetical protein